jgi:8-oxo-dGTP pyrophosphatase MutT (NUDIX family)
MTSMSAGSGKPAPPVRPVDAAGLVLLRGSAEAPEVLMGRRHKRASFLPDIYVFPGGRLDDSDLAPSGFPERIDARLVQQLSVGNRRRVAMPLLRAAVRETFEETGLLLAGEAHGTPGDVETAPKGPPSAAKATRHSPIWQAFAAIGRRPAFETMDFVCRAITPASSPKRFNTRFFLADGGSLEGSLLGDGELEDLAWRPVTRMWHMALVDVTEFVLREALKRWQERVSVGSRPAPLFCYVNDTARVRLRAHILRRGPRA